jgi:hypothetical protein
VPRERKNPRSYRCEGAEVETRTLYVPGEAATNEASIRPEESIRPLASRMAVEKEDSAKGSPSTFTPS